MKLKLACADFTFPLLPHGKVLDRIAMLEFQGVDLGLFEGRSHLWPSREFRNPIRSGSVLGRALKGRGLKPADVFLQMAPDFHAYAINHPRPSRRLKARDWFERSLDYAGACGSRHVTVLPGVFFQDETRSASLARAVEELRWRVERSAAHGIVLGAEAHVGSLVPEPRGAENLVRQVPGLTLTLDYTHFTRSGLPDSAAAPLVPLASHFHARGARKGRLQTSFRDSTINYRRIVRALQRSDYRGWLGIEYVWIDWEHCNECDNLSETIRFRDFFRSLFTQN